MGMYAGIRASGLVCRVQDFRKLRGPMLHKARIAFDARCLREGYGIYGPPKHGISLNKYEHKSLTSCIEPAGMSAVKIEFAKSRGLS